MKCIRLIDIKEGEKAVIESLDCSDDIRHRLCSLGVLKGKAIEMIKNDSDGPVMIKVLDSKLAIGRNQATKIYICTAKGK